MGSAGRTSFKRPSTSSFFSVTTPSHQRATPDPSQDSEAMFCHHCDDSLAGHRYVLRDDHPYCIKCYENVFANNCDECGKIIGIDSKDLSYKEKHWHEACFLCNKCRTSLVDKQFGSKVSRRGNIRWKYFRWLKIFSRLLKIF